MTPEQPAPQANEALKISDGYSAIIFPNLQSKDHFGDEKTPTPEEVLTKLNDFLTQVNAQGAEIINMFDMEVKVGTSKGGGSIGEIIETRK